MLFLLINPSISSLTALLFDRNQFRRGFCFINNPSGITSMESCFNILKTEHVYFEDYQARTHARESIFEWIEVFTNLSRSLEDADA